MKPGQAKVLLSWNTPCPVIPALWIAIHWLCLKKTRWKRHQTSYLDLKISPGKQSKLTLIFQPAHFLPVPLKQWALATGKKSLP